MPVVHEGLESELAHVENPDEQRHIRALWDEADPQMQEISYQLIVGHNVEVDQLTQRGSGGWVLGEHHHGRRPDRWHGHCRNQVQG